MATQIIKDPVLNFSDPNQCNLCGFEHKENICPQCGYISNLKKVENKMSSDSKLVEMGLQLIEVKTKLMEETFSKYKTQMDQANMNMVTANLAVEALIKLLVEKEITTELEIRSKVEQICKEAEEAYQKQQGHNVNKV